MQKPRSSNKPNKKTPEQQIERLKTEMNKEWVEDFIVF